MLTMNWSSYKPAISVINQEVRLIVSSMGLSNACNCCSKASSTTVEAYAICDTIVSQLSLFKAEEISNIYSSVAY